jgi:outer membrane receptor protein involved in Fe transport
VLNNPPGLDARFRGLELTFDLHLGDRMRLLVSGTAHRVDGDAASRGFRATEDDPGLVGERFDAPNADTNARGRLFFDRAYTIKLAGRWRAPGDVRLGWVARYQDGQPFARLLLVPDLPQGPDLVRAVPDGRHRFAYTLTVDARAEKGFRLGRHRLRASVEAFNLLQTRHEAEEDVLTGPAFRTPTFVQPPRTVRAGLRLDL